MNNITHFLIKKTMHLNKATEKVIDFTEYAGQLVSFLYAIALSTLT
jgi:hypothetical protein